MNKREFTFLSADHKTRIHAIVWEPDGECRGVLQICHGMVEYIDRYDEFACYLNERGDTIVPYGKYRYCQTDTIKKIGFVYENKPKDARIICINDAGKELFYVFKYDNGPDYIQEGLFRIMNEDGLVGFADSLGNVAIKPQFKFAYPFEHGKAKVTFSGENKVIPDSKGEKHYRNNSDWYYINKDSSIVTDEFKEIDGKLYYFEYDGVMKMGDFYIYDSETGTSKRYYADENGKITRNDWYQAGVDWYYADANGQKETNKWIDETYYLNESGAMVRGTCRIEGIEYFFDNNGKYIGTSAKDGWSYSDGSWFYYKDGEAYTGWVNNKYWVEDGELCTGRFIEDGGKYYYVNCEGIYQTGWIKTEENEWWGEWTYANASGEIVNDGWQSIGGDWYYFKDGVINQFPIIETEDYGACTFKSDGRYTGRAKRSNWYYINEKWYYVKAEGSLARGKETINGHTYYFNSGFTSALLQNEYYSEYDNNSNKSVSVWVNSNGEKDMSNGWKYTGHTYYYVENGAFKNGWLSYGGNWYYLEPGMARGIEFVEYNGEYEYAFFDENGVYHKLTDGWKSIKTEEGFTDWYYVKNGKPASGYVDGYHFYRNGYLDTGIYWSDSGKVYYYDENGKMLKGTGWYLDKYDTWHYIYSDGTMATGERTIGGKKYWFTGYGDWIR